MTKEQDIYMGVVYDSLRIMGENYKDFYINIKPVCGYTTLIQGPCFTTFGEKVSVSKEEYEKLDNIRLLFYKEKLFKNKPIIFLQANDTEVAHSGDITSLIYKNLGAIGFVTDGNVRDIDIIENMNFPIFCKGENPIDAINYWALTKYQTEIEIQGVKITPSDYAFASRDGVIVVRAAILDKFRKTCSEQLLRENKIRKMINNKNVSYENIVNKMGRW